MEVVIQRVTVIDFRMDNGGGNGADCFEIEIWADKAKFTYVIAGTCVVSVRKYWRSIHKNNPNVAENSAVI